MIEKIIRLYKEMNVVLSSIFSILKIIKVRDEVNTEKIDFLMKNCVVEVPKELRRDWGNRLLAVSL